MKLDLDDFSNLKQLSEKRDEIEGEEIEESDKFKKLETFYKERLKDIEKKYEGLLAKTKKESYEKGFYEAQQKFQALLQEERENIERQKEEEKKAVVEKFHTALVELEKKLQTGYRDYLEKLTDTIVEALGDILEFLYIDKSNSPLITEAMEQLLEEFRNFLPVTIQVPSNLYEEVKSNFSAIEVKKRDDLKDNEFVVEFQDFVIENKIEEKIKVIKDEIKREVKNLT